RQTTARTGICSYGGFLKSPLYLIALTIYGVKTAVADPQALIIAGDKEFYKISQQVWDTEVARGIKPILMAGRGDWGFAKAGIQFPAHGKESVEAAIKLAAGQLRPGDSLTIFISPHGTAPDSLEDPLSSKIILDGGASISHRELMALIGE